LSLAYAQAHPDRVKSLTLRFVPSQPLFVRPKAADNLQRHLYAPQEVVYLYVCLWYALIPPTSELRFFYQEGASHLFPEAW
jgi:hypothetical protein